MVFHLFEFPEVIMILHALRIYFLLYYYIIGRLTDFDIFLAFG
jgi:hypothetical protein